MNPAVLVAIGIIGLGGFAVVAGFDHPPVDSVQRGFRGTGMIQVNNPRVYNAHVAANQAPAAEPPAEPSDQKANEVYENVQVLGELPVEQFNRLMVSITNWVSPVQGCAYCHGEGGNFATDHLYTKVVARRMIQMTQHVNADWKAHVAPTGVVCYTCHRGNPVPAQIWFKDPGPERAPSMMAVSAGQNIAAPAVGLASLPYDPFTPYLQGNHPIGVNGKTALPEGNNHSIKEAEWTYGLMMHMSTSLGVNCTYCHNTRAFADWSQSPPTRVTAWYGIRMARDLNNNYLEPLGPQYPQNRLGALGDAPKANCGTCHLGAFKPLYGAPMLKDHPELASPGPWPEMAFAPAAAPLPPVLAAK